jgi:hypothetical protein
MDCTCKVKVIVQVGFSPLLGPEKIRTQSLMTKKDSSNTTPSSLPLVLHLSDLGSQRAEHRL